MDRIVTIPYAPRPLQLHIHNSAKRFTVLVCHRRFGKTVMAINHLIRAAATCELERPRFAYLAPLYKQAKSVAWDYLKHYSAPIPGATTNESELRCDLPNEARISLLGADNPDALRGIYLDGVVLDEPSQMRPSVFSEIIRPALSDRKGWAMFIGTPKGHNAFHDLFQDAMHGFRDSNGQRSGPDPEWLSALYRASDTNILDGAELESARSLMSADEYAQEYECSFDAAIRGAYYADQFRFLDKEDRIGSVPWEPSVPVQTAWDLGIDDATAIWFAQCVGREVHIIDYYEASGVGIDHYAQLLKSKPYTYADSILPHDGGAREKGTGISISQYLSNLGIRNNVLPREDIEPGIQAVRNLLQKCWFDRTKCADGLEALRQYRTEWDEKRETPRPRPLHDWTSHGADAFRYLSLGLAPVTKKKPRQREAAGSHAWMGS